MLFGEEFEKICNCFWSSLFRSSSHVVLCVTSSSRNGCGAVDWIDLVQDKDVCRAILNIEYQHIVHKKPIFCWTVERPSTS